MSALKFCAVSSDVICDFLLNNVLIISLVLLLQAASLSCFSGRKLSRMSTLRACGAFHYIELIFKEVHVWNLLVLA